MSTTRTARTLAVDGLMNVVLGVTLLFFRPLGVWLGIPDSETVFYPMVLGGVLFGIGIALFIESFRKPGGLVGLGLGGAIAINLSGGAVLAGWLIAGGLELPLRGLILLWALAVVLVGISLVELITYRRAAA